MRPALITREHAAGRMLAGSDAGRFNECRVDSAGTLICIHRHVSQFQASMRPALITREHEIVARAHLALLLASMRPALITREHSYQGTAVVRRIHSFNEARVDHAGTPDITGVPVE